MRECLEARLNAMKVLREFEEFGLLAEVVLRHYESCDHPDCPVRKLSDELVDALKMAAIVWENPECWEDDEGWVETKIDLDEGYVAILETARRGRN